MSIAESGSPWICHVCDFKSTGTESRACSVCYKTTCATHLKKVPTYNPESGLFEIQPVCVFCAGKR